MATFIKTPMDRYVNLDTIQYFNYDHHDCCIEYKSISGETHKYAYFENFEEMAVAYDNLMNNIMNGRFSWEPMDSI